MGLTSLSFQSTHPRRVWLLIYLLWVPWNVSIHTPTQGVTDETGKWDYSLKVSIHTPTQGVTCHSRSGRQAGERFNPHTHAGCDLTHHHHSNHYYVSIHTPTQGVTASPDAPLRTACFNPHTHAGCDVLVAYLHYGILSFNPHTHAGCDILYPF